MIGTMFRWFFILAGVAAIMIGLSLVAPSVITAVAFTVAGLAIHWGYLIGALAIYVGYRVTK